MNSVTSIIAMCLVMLLSSYGTDAQWKTYQPDSSGCKVMFPPGSIDDEEQCYDSEAGAIVMKMYLHDPESDDDNYAYALIVTAFPYEQMSSDNKELVPTIFRNSIDGAVTNVKGELITEEVHNYKDYPGRDIKVKMDVGESAFLYGRIYLIEKKMYMLQVIAPLEKDGNASIKRFLDSFELL